MIDTTAGTLNTSSATGDGGTIVLNATNAIRTGAINTSSLSENGGNVILDPIGDIEVASINAQGGSNGRGGTVDITTEQFFRSTEILVDRNGIAASISTAGGQGGGAITIRHGGQGQIPFSINNATQNGTAGAITSGTSSIRPPQSFLFTTIEGNIQIISVPPPIVPPEPVPSPQPFPIVNPAAQSEVELLPLPESEAQFNTAYERHLELTDTPLKTLADARRELQAIEAATGIKPALIYVFFTPQSGNPGVLTPPPDQPKPDQPKELQELDVLWQFTPPGLTADRVAQTQIERERNLARPDDRLQLVLITATGTPVVKLIPITRQEVQRVADLFRSLIVQSNSLPADYLPLATQLHQWMIAPLEADLRDRDVQNIAFILDVRLRSLPLAALYDGKRFLVEAYSIGLMPSLSLTDTRYADTRTMRLLAMGTDQFRNLPTLPAVPVELSTIANFWGGKSLTDEAFTPQRLTSERQKQPFGIVHLATHGEFQSGELRNSYIAFWEQRLLLDQIQQLQLDNPPAELLVLSACRTALGDEQAELGFAGAAAKTGVKSVLASLWYVGDLATLALMNEFYRQLKQAPIKAEALQQTQIAMLKGQVRLAGNKLTGPGGRSIVLPPELLSSSDPSFTHPFYWSAFTLIGSPW